MYESYQCDHNHVNGNETRTMQSQCGISTPSESEMKLAECANSVDLDEVAHYEPPHLDLHGLPSSL